MKIRGAVAVLALALAASACSHSSTIPAVPGGARPMARAWKSALAAAKIKHVVFIIQENRTFDNIFGGPNPFPGADAASSGMTSTGKTRKLSKIYFFPSLDVNNFHQPWLTACNPPSPPPFTVGGPSPCRMNGFDKNQKLFEGNIYSYVDYNETKPYWSIAKTYTLGDHFFMGHNSESYTGHQYIFSGQSNNVVDAPVYPHTELPFVTPWGCDSPKGTTTFSLNPQTGRESPTSSGPFPCFGAPTVTYPSLADLVNAKGLTWRMYSFIQDVNINALDVNTSIRNNAKYWNSSLNFRTPQTQILKDLSGKLTLSLASVTWVLPGPLSSDHPGTPSFYGPSWVADVVNAIGQSPQWNDTVIFVFWDDWGGFYDHVPPYVVRDQAGPGFRVPLLVISPYSKRGYVASTNIEFGTLLNFTESTLGLGSLGADDASPYLNNLDDFFNFTTSPQPFKPVATEKPPAFFEHLDERAVLRAHPGNSHFWDGIETGRDGDD
jgi:phospholipase C